MTNGKLAFVLLGVVACGDNRYHGIDAMPGVVPTDSLGPSGGDPGTDAVAVTVTDFGAPAASVPVYFLGPDGAVVKQETTDTRGIAWAVVPDGGSVTAIEPANPSGATALTTFSAVQHGDRLHLDLDPVIASPSISVTLHMPGGGAPNYVIYNSCGDPVSVGPSGVNSVPLVDCGRGTIDLLAVRLDDEGAPVDALYAPAVAISDAADITLPGDFAAFAAMKFLYMNVPSNISWMGTYTAILTPRGRPFAASVGVAPANGSAEDAMMVPPIANTTTMLAVSDALPDASAVGEQLVYDWAPFDPSYVMDTAAKQLPEYATRPTFDPASHAIAWTEMPGTLAPNFVRARIHAYRDDIPEGRAWTWRIVGPRTGTSIAFPHLPVESFDFNPIATDVVVVDDLTIASLPGGYAGIRAGAFRPLTTAIAGDSGTIVLEIPYTPAL